MDESRVAHVLRICDEALARDSDKRDAYVETACAGDAEMRREVDAVLMRQAHSRGFLETPPWALPTPRSSSANASGLTR